MRFESVEAAEEVLCVGPVDVELWVSVFEQVVAQRFNAQTFSVCMEESEEDVEGVVQAGEEFCRTLQNQYKFIADTRKDSYEKTIKLYLLFSIDDVTNFFKNFDPHWMECTLEASVEQVWVQGQQVRI